MEEGGARAGGAGDDPATSILAGVCGLRRLCWLRTLVIGCLRSATPTPPAVLAGERGRPSSHRSQAWISTAAIAGTGWRCRLGRVSARLEDLRVGKDGPR